MLGVLEATLLLKVVVHLVLDDALGHRDIEGVDEVLEDLVAGLQALLELLGALGGGVHLCLELIESVELRRQLGEVVIELRQLALLDRLDRDRALGVLARVVAPGQRRGERRRLAGTQPGERLIEADEHIAAADLVGDAGHLVDGLLADGGGQVDGDEVAHAGRPLNRDQGAEAGPQLVEALGDVLVGDHDVIDGNRDGVEVGQGDLWADVDLGGEGQRLGVVHGHRGDLDLGLPDRADLGLLDSLAVEVREGLVDGLLQHGAATHPLVDDPRRNLALAESGDRDLRPDRDVGRVDARLELVIRDLDGQLDPRGAQGLGSGLHQVALQQSDQGSGTGAQQSSARAHRNGGVAASILWAAAVTPKNAERRRGSRI